MNARDDQCLPYIIRDGCVEHTDAVTLMALLTLLIICCAPFPCRIDPQAGTS